MKKETLAKNILIYLKTFAYYLPLGILAYYINVFLYTNHIGKAPTGIGFILGFILAPIFIKPIAQYSVEKSKRSIKQQYFQFFFGIILMLITLYCFLYPKSILDTIEHFLEEFQ